MNSVRTSVSLLLLLFVMTFSIHSYPFTANIKLSSSQIDRLCSVMEGEKSAPLTKRFAIPFPGMNRFLSNSPKLHHGNRKSDNDLGRRKNDFHAYLCSISKDEDEMANFLSIFIEEHGEVPAFDLFASCEQIVKREQREIESAVPWKTLEQVCSDRGRVTNQRRAVLDIQSDPYLGDTAAIVETSAFR